MGTRDGGRLECVLGLVDCFFRCSRFRVRMGVCMGVGVLSEEGVPFAMFRSVTGFAIALVLALWHRCFDMGWDCGMCG